MFLVLNLRDSIILGGTPSLVWDQSIKSRAEEEEEEKEQEEEETFIKTKYIRRETLAKVYKSRSREGHPAISM